MAEVRSSSMYNWWYWNHKGLREYLDNKPLAYIDEMIYFIWDEYDIMVSESAIKRCLKRIKWSRKVVYILDILILIIFDDFWWF
jgi:hypothetical protein